MSLLKLYIFIFISVVEVLKMGVPWVGPLAIFFLTFAVLCHGSDLDFDGDMTLRYVVLIGMDRISGFRISGKLDINKTFLLLFEDLSQMFQLFE